MFQLQFGENRANWPDFGDTFPIFRKMVSAFFENNNSNSLLLGHFSIIYIYEHHIKIWCKYLISVKSYESTNVLVHGKP